MANQQNPQNHDLPEPNFNEPEPDLHNTIEYEVFQREIDPAKPKKNDFRQPEKPSVAQTPLTTELKTDELKRPVPEQEKSQANTGLNYEVPEHLKNRMVAVNTQRFRVTGYEMGAHLLRYTAPNNPKTVLFEDKGKTIQTARDDKQTIQDMLDVAKAKDWDSIKISGSQEFRQQMWLEAESRGIATTGYKPSPEDLALLEHRRNQRATNSITEAESLKQQSAVPKKDGSSLKSIPHEAIQAANDVKAAALQTVQPTTKEQYQQKVGALDWVQQTKAQFYEKLGLAVLEHMPSEAREKAMQTFYENQADKIQNGKFHAPDPMKSVPEQEQSKPQEHTPSCDDWEMER